MNTTELENKIKNLTYIVVIGFIVMFILLIGLYFKGDSASSTDDNTEVTQPSNSSSDYDTSKLTLLDKASATELTKSKGIRFVFVGRSGCGVCKAYLPNLNEVIDALDIEVNYMSLDNKNWRTDYADLFTALDDTTTITDSKGESHTGTYGELLEEFGFTPLTIVLKDGKMVDGFVGSRDVNTTKEFFDKYI